MGALLVEPEDPSCAAGVIFFNNVGYLGMCGHGTIGVVATLAHLGRLKPGRHRIDTPVGSVGATLAPDGTVTVENVPSYRKAAGVRVEAPGVGSMVGDVAWGGNWFYLIADHRLELALGNVEALTEYAWHARMAINRQGYPEVDHVELFGPPSGPTANARNFVLCPGKAYDRSPCGTAPAPNSPAWPRTGSWRRARPGSRRASWGARSWAATGGRGDKILPSVTGAAYIVAESTLLLDARDPFCWVSGLSATFDIAIVGAGIVGCACAAECARGGLRVLLLERGPIGGGTTAAGMGHVVVMDDSPAQFALTRYSSRLWRELAGQLPAEVEDDVCGTLWVAADEQELAEARRKEEYYRSRGVAVEVWDAAALRQGEPHLRSDLVGGLRVPGDRVIYPPSAARFLSQQAQQAGAAIRTGVEVRRLLPEGGVELANGERIPAGIALNATGPWSPTLSPGLPVRKRKGHLVITDRYPGYVHHQIVELGYLKSAHGATKDSVAFNIQPRKTGQMLVGSSRQFDEEGAEIDPILLKRMLHRAFEYLPSLAGLSALRAWTGHRAATPDKLPLIGPDPRHERVWLATGHEGLGITTSLATGRLVADLLLRRPTEIPATPYSPERLAQVEVPHG